jgi:hypothetical protein
MVPEVPCVEEHEEGHESIATGPYGEQTVTLSVEDDIQVHEAVGSSAVGLHGLSGGGSPREPAVPGSPTYPPGHHFFFFNDRNTWKLGRLFCVLIFVG